MKTFLLILCAAVVTTHIVAQANLDVIKVPDPKNAGKSIKCGPEGTAKDGTNPKSHLAFIGNPQKNRWDIPKASEIQVLSIDDLLKAKKSKYKPGTPVEITAYVFDVKPGGQETCNCGTKAVGFKDTHIELTPSNRKTTEKSRLVVEVTPRLRMMMEDEGIDWSTTHLKNEFLGQMVTVQGWLFYDEIHESEAFASDPQDEKGDNWRGSAWEIHPVTSIEPAEESEDDNMIAANADAGGNNEYESITPTSGPVRMEASAIQEPKSASDLLSIILLGGVLGMIGQGVRVVVGLKKLNSGSTSKLHYDNQFDTKKLVLSLVYAAVIGFVAGALMSVDSLDAVWDKSTVLATIATGYAGVDFIEGFLTSKLPSGNSAVVAPQAVTVVRTGKKNPPEGGIVQE